MSENTLGLSNAVQLVPNSKPLKLELCLICQNVKDSAGLSKLTSLEACRETMINTSRKLDDDLVTNIDQNTLADIRYHVQSCCAPYKKKGPRHNINTLKRKPGEPNLSPLTSPVTQPKRSKTITYPDSRGKPCFIRNHVKCQAHTKTFQIKSLVVAEVQQGRNSNRLFFLKETGYVCAKDIMYHNNCMNMYTSKF